MMSRVVAVAQAKLGGGDGGIRTLDRPLQAYNGLANRRLQPLGHVSSKADMPDAAASRKRQIWRSGRTDVGAVPDCAGVGFFQPIAEGPSWVRHSLRPQRQEFILCLKIADFLPIPECAGTANAAQGRRGWCVYIECRIKTARLVALPYNGVDSTSCARFAVMDSQIDARDSPRAACAKGKTLAAAARAVIGGQIRSFENC